MATEARAPVLDRRELFRRLIGRKIELTTVCGTFSKATGQIKEVFDDFLMFLTARETPSGTEVNRHWVLFDAITVITEAPKVAAEDLQIER